MLFLFMDVYCLWRSPICTAHNYLAAQMQTHIMGQCLVSRLSLIHTYKNTRTHMRSPMPDSTGSSTVAAGSVQPHPPFPLPALQKVARWADRKLCSAHTSISAAVSICRSQRMLSLIGSKDPRSVLPATRLQTSRDLVCSCYVCTLHYG